MANIKGMRFYFAVLLIAVHLTLTRRWQTPKLGQTIHTAGEAGFIKD